MLCIVTLVFPVTVYVFRSCFRTLTIICVSDFVCDKDVSAVTAHFRKAGTLGSKMSTEYMIKQQRVHFRKMGNLDSQNVHRVYDHATESTFQKDRNFRQPKCLQRI